MGRENLGRALWRALVVHRFAAIAIIDVAIWIGTIVLGLFLRFELGVPGSAWSEAAPAFLIVASAQLIFGIGSGMYLGRWQLGSFEEVAGLVRTLAAVGVTLAILDRFLGLVPMSIVAFAPVAALVLCGAVRYGWRLAVDRRKRPTHEHVLPMVVFGAGEGADPGHHLDAPHTGEPLPAGGDPRRRPPQGEPPHPRRPGARCRP